VGRTAAAGLLAGLVAALAFGGYLGVRRPQAPPEEAVRLLLAAAASAGLAGALVHAAGRWAGRRRLARLEGLAAALGNEPDAEALRRARQEMRQADLAGVWGQVEELAARCRAARVEAARARERLDRLRSALAPADGEPGDRAPLVGPTHPAAGPTRRMVARLAPNLKVVAATPALRQFLGRAGNELPGRSFLDVVHPDDAPPLRVSLREALRDGEGHDVTFRVVLPAAKEAGGPAERFVQMNVLTCYDETDAPLNLRCHFLDITERVQGERELRRVTREMAEANARLRQTNEALERLKNSYLDLYNQTPVLYFSLDPQGRLDAVNEYLLRTLGYTREELRKQPYEVLLAPAARAAYRADPTMLQRNHEVPRTQWVKKDGSVIDVHIATTASSDAAGRFLRSRSAARDITEMCSKAEEARRANRQLKRINQELEEFTHVVSHDLKEPLRTLEAFSNFLAQDYGPLLGGEGQEYINHLVQASRRLGALIDDLLTLSRTGRVIHTPRAFDWNPVTATVLGDLHDLIQRTQAVVRVEGPLPPVLGDPERVIQLLANLVANALRYNNNPRPEVVIGWAVGVEPVGKGSHHALTLGAAGPPEMVTLFVRDNGIGIDPAYHEQIFRIFRRLHRRDEVEGTGAGLAICKRIVEAHGGRIWVDSKVGQGATFLFTLPRQKPAGRPAGGAAG
jgi:PAS domain S-box-containing protein